MEKGVGDEEVGNWGQSQKGPRTRGREGSELVGFWRGRVWGEGLQKTQLSSSPVAQVPFWKGCGQGRGWRTAAGSPSLAPTRRCKRLPRRQRRWLQSRWQAVRICRLRTHPTGEKRTHFTDTSPPGGQVHTHPPTRRRTGRRDRHGHRHTRGERVFQTASVCMLLLTAKLSSAQNRDLFCNL